MDAILKRNVSNLNQNDKLELLELLWVNLRETQPTDEIKIQHIAILKKRLADFRTNIFVTKPWNEVVKKYDR